MGFKFKKNMQIGSAAAEEDGVYLEKCFIDNGDLLVAMNVHDSRMFIRGRTGTGKTALLMQMARMKPQQVIQISPDSLALNRIANSQVLQFFEDLGVRLDPFYKLLWRHVFTVELIKTRYRIKSEDEKKTFLNSILPHLKRDKKKMKALEYIRQWGEKFWEQTEYRIVETTERIERDLEGVARLSLGPVVQLSATISRKLSAEQKGEIRKKGQEIVNSVQIKALNDVIALLSEDCLTDPQHPYYIVIDGLDDEWIDESLRYRLIMALLQAAKDYFKVENAKVLVALRRDLMARVFRKTRGGGQQEEKYESLCLDLTWTSEQLTTLVDKRITSLVREEYTKKPVGLKDVMPRHIQKEDPIKYILDRTFLRPRDCILFINQCIKESPDKPKFTQKYVLAAESVYSRNRLRSVGDEWQIDYPELLDFAKLLHGQPASFTLSDFPGTDFADRLLEILTQSDTRRGPLWHGANKVLMEDAPQARFVQDLFAVFYRVGFVGLRKRMSENRQYSYKHEPQVNPLDIEENARVYVHKTFWPAFGIMQQDR